jgi:hypothetical protein
MNTTGQCTLTGTRRNRLSDGIPAYCGIAVLLDCMYRKMNIIHEQFKFIRAPRIVIKQLASNPRAAFIGFRHVLFLAVLWEIAVLLWALGGATTTMPAFLKIPEDRYYFYQLIFMIPMFLLTWLLAGGIAYLLSKALGGIGSVDTILGGFGMAAPIAGYFALVPDFVQGLLWTTDWMAFEEYQELTSHGLAAVLVWAYMLAYSIGYLILYFVTIRHAQGLSVSKSALVASMAYFLSALFFIVVVR